MYFSHYFAEWRNVRSGHLTLQDVDVTSESFGGWKELNTLAHYGVRGDSAVMSLTARGVTSNHYQGGNHCKQIQSCRNCEFSARNMLSAFSLEPIQKLCKL